MSSKTRLKGSSAIVRYGSALIGVALATAIRISLSGVLGARLPFTTYFIAAILVAIYCGLGPALLTVVLGAAVGLYLFIPPANEFAISEGPALSQLIAFSVLAGGLSVLIKVVRDARRKAQQNALALSESRERLA